jgi:hypothetical protein
LRIVPLSYKTYMNNELMLLKKNYFRVLSSGRYSLADVY